MLNRGDAPNGFSFDCERIRQFAPMLATVDLASGFVVRRECFRASAVDQSSHDGVADRFVTKPFVL